VLPLLVCVAFSSLISLHEGFSPLHSPPVDHSLHLRHLRKPRQRRYQQLGLIKGALHFHSGMVRKGPGPLLLHS